MLSARALEQQVLEGGSQFLLEFLCNKSGCHSCQALAKVSITSESGNIWLKPWSNWLNGLASLHGQNQTGFILRKFED